MEDSRQRHRNLSAQVATKRPSARANWNRLFMATTAPKSFVSDARASLAVRNDDAERSEAHTLFRSHAPTFLRFFSQALIDSATSKIPVPHAGSITFARVEKETADSSAIRSANQKSV